MLIKLFSALLLSCAVVSAEEKQSNLHQIRRSREVQENPPCATFPPGRVYHILSKNSGHALHVYGGSTGTMNVVQWRSGNDQDWFTFDNWILEPGALPDHYVLTAEHTTTGFHLGLAENEASPGNGGNLVLKGAMNVDFDEWCFIPRGDSFYEIRNRSGYDVHVWGASQEPGANVVQWIPLGVDNELWKLVELPRANSALVEQTVCAVLPANTYYHIVAKHSGQALAVTGASIAHNTRVVQEPLGSDAANNNFRLDLLPNGLYAIVAQHSGQFLQTDGNDIVQSFEKEGELDEWCFEDVGDGYYNIRNGASGEVIDVYRDNMASGAYVGQWKMNGRDNQKFQLIPAPDARNNPTFTSPWSGPYKTPVIAVSTANLPDGRVLMWSAFKRDDYIYGTGKTWTAIFDPSGNGFTESLVVDTQHDMFCPGTASLSDGRVLVTGGSDSAKVSIFDPSTDSWSIGAEMNIPRGYHGMTALGNGSVFAFGGSWSGGVGGKVGEIWTDGDGWRVLSNVKTPSFETEDVLGTSSADNHFWLFQAPDGRVFHAGPSKKMHWIDTFGDGRVEPSILRGDDDHAMNGNAVMFDIGKILTIGGAPNYNQGTGVSNRSYVIDVNGSEAVVKRSGNMAVERTLFNSVLLPSGEVVVIGGMSKQPRLFSDRNAVYLAEIWNPQSETFTKLPSMKIPRTYHSTAILMKDGRILAAGGGLCGSCDANHQDMEFMIPPYLLNNDGSLASRPVITSAPQTTLPGATLDVVMDTRKKHTFALMRISAVTHSVNNDQRRIPLTVSAQAGRNFALKVPSNPNVSITGVYYLFAMNSAGVPSEAVDIQIAV